MLNTATGTVTSFEAAISAAALSPPEHDERHARRLLLGFHRRDSPQAVRRIIGVIEAQRDGDTDRVQRLLTLPAAAKRGTHRSDPRQLPPKPKPSTNAPW
jgi:hypothetical protein